VERWGWYDGSAWKFSARSGANESFGDVTSSGSFQANSGSGVAARVRFQTNGANRWSFYKDASAESGADAGASLAITAWSDAGTIIDNPVVIQRPAGGQIQLNRPVKTSTGFAAFGVTPPATRPTVNAACTDLATCIALTNQLRTHLIACGLVQ
jgi:hypothetical protein